MTISHEIALKRAREFTAQAGAIATMTGGEPLSLVEHQTAMEAALRDAENTRLPKAKRDEAHAKVMALLDGTAGVIAAHLGDFYQALADTGVGVTPGATSLGMGNAPFASAIEAAAHDEGRNGIFDVSRISQEGRTADRITFDATRAALFKRGNAGMPLRDPRSNRVETDYGEVARPRMIDAFGRELPYENIAAGNYIYLGETITPGASDANMPQEKSEGAASPEMNIVYAEKTVPFQTIRADIPVSMEVLDDVTMTRDILEGRMIDAARYRAERQMLNGSGAAPSVQGLLGLSDINTTTRRNTTGERPKATSVLDAIGDMMGSIDAADGRTTALFVNSNIWYGDILGGRGTDDHWVGLPEHIRNIPLIVPTPLLQSGATEADTIAVVGDFATHADVVVRKDAEVIAGYKNDDFTKYQLRLLVVARLCFVWYRPAAFGKLTRAADGSAD